MEIAEEETCAVPGSVTSPICLLILSLNVFVYNVAGFGVVVGFGQSDVKDVG